MRKKVDKGSSLIRKDANSAHKPSKLSDIDVFAVMTLLSSLWQHCFEKSSTEGVEGVVPLPED